LLQGQDLIGDIRVQFPNAVGTNPVTEGDVEVLGDILDQIMPLSAYVPDSLA
jgi:hypothetical protein